MTTPPVQHPAGGTSGGGPPLRIALRRHPEGTIGILGRDTDIDIAGTEEMKVKHQSLARPHQSRQNTEGVARPLQITICEAVHEIDRGRDLALR
jgi:hypothetical protein